MNALREACLKPEFAHLYPGLTPGTWYKASWISARQFAREPCDGVASSIARMVDDSHFDFRGGRTRSAMPEAD